MNKNPISQARFNEFVKTYLSQLEKACAEHPGEYPWLGQPDMLDGGKPTTPRHVAARMQGAILKGSYNKDSRAFKGTCKALGIAHTYTAIETFLRPNAAPDAVLKAEA